MTNVSYRTVPLDHAEYPALLREIPGAPESFYIRGALPENDTPCVAIVGTRKATSSGKEMARDIASQLTERGCIIVSGLAFGIDAAAHEGALSAKGKTIAVLGNGIDSVYPASHESLAMRILESGGGILSEYGPGIPAYPNQFLARNRIVSGLCIATVIIEAPKRSGTLVTAKHALDQGREVFVVPGPAVHPHFQGSHELIRVGARLVRGASDILEDLASSFPTITITSTPHSYVSKDGAEQTILDILRNTPSSLTVDELVDATKLETHIIGQKLTFLILENIVEETHGMFKLKRTHS